MFAKAIQGMPAKDAIKWATSELKKVYEVAEKRTTLRPAGRHAGETRMITSDIALPKERIAPRANGATT